MAATLASAAPAEEVFVVADRFARWDDTRWYVEGEMMTPFPVVFARDAVAGFRSHAFQVRAVLECNKDARLTRRQWEVMCRIEDIGLQATTIGLWHSPEQLAGVQSILDEVDAKLTGALIQLQVDDQGALRNVDVEDLPARNERERKNHEVLRQVMARVVSGFHLKIADEAWGGATWLERNSLLLQLPSLTGVRGSTRLLHTSTQVDDTAVVQSEGDGIITMTIPYHHSRGADVNLEAPAPVATTGGNTTVGGYKATGAISGPTPSEFVTNRELMQPLPGFGRAFELEESEVTDLEAVYQMQGRSVSVMDRGLGFVVERVWVVDGACSPSSGGGVQTAPYRHVGRLRLLGTDERPDIGGSHQIAPPTRTFDNLPSWTSLEL